MRFRTGLLFQLFKYTVYSLLTLNIVLFFLEDHAAVLVKSMEGLTPALILEGYATSIDTAAWVILLLVFELETYILDDRHFTRTVNRLLTAIRVVCLAFIVFAFYGYSQTMLSAYQLKPAPAVTDLCSVAGTGDLYAIDESEYAVITSENCAALSEEESFQRFADSDALADNIVAVHIQRLAWADVVNAGVWILIVILLEIDVRLQERNRYEGVAFRTSMALKAVFYPALFIVAVYWGIKGDFIDFWDAFLWLVAFLFIENNILEWREEERAASA
ncbi:MAG: hypothetical protein QNJ19_03755 [Woeseiaceae bacterium]|nr:hypothetical protein [Woeseiaceae bacterium]